MIREKPERYDQAQAVYERLAEFYGLPEWSEPHSPLDELINTILSQNTNDRNRDLAFGRLRQAFPGWEAVRDAPPEAVQEAIRPAGLANQKGPRIQEVLQQITAERGELSLDFLREVAPDEALGYLTHFNGVGPKTASIVMLFTLNMPAFPVDTHIYRVTGRLGLRPEKMSADQAHDYLATLFTSDQYGPGHLNIIRLGREICQARRPRCEVCPLTDLCDYFQQVVRPAISL